VGDDKNVNFNSMCIGNLRLKCYEQDREKAKEI
jgi:hypothetical protein